MKPDSGGWDFDENETPDTALYCFKSSMDPLFNQAKENELQSWRQFGAFESVKDQGQAKLSTRWVCTEKADGRLKARLVVRGFEDPDIDTSIKTHQRAQERVSE